MAALTGSALSAVIYDFNYETAATRPNSSGEGTANNRSYSITTDAVTSSNVGNAAFDATGQTGNFSFAHLLNNGRNGVAATSLTASDYILSFDVKALGLATASFSAQVQLTFNFTSQRQTNINVSNTFQSYDLNLGSDFSSSPAFTLANLNNNIQFRVTDFSSHNNFGRDAGNSIIFDNVQLNQVPEPSSLAAFSLAAGAAMFVRRRRA